MITKKKIAICHYRAGGTDGVSLEIDKRKQILEKLGYRVKLIAGRKSTAADFIIPELEWDSKIISIIKENSYEHFDRNDLDNVELRTKINKIARSIKNKLDKIQEKEKFDAALIHNIFSFGGHVAAAKAFTQWINEYKILCLATHHDFHWENKEYLITRNQYLKKYIKKYMPPQSPYIKHAVINSLAQQQLKKRYDIDAVITSDIFDFNQPPWTKDNYNKNFLPQLKINPWDIVVLQATRVIPRKGIEIAIDFVEKLRQNMEQLKNKSLYNGKKITARSNVVLLVAGYAENEKRHYIHHLKKRAETKQVNIKFISDYIQSARARKNGKKFYSLWDAYVYADIVTFPSLREGWGNQFIEAVFAKKPVVIFEYPVFKKDIKKEGYEIISLDSEILTSLEDGLHKIPAQNMARAADKAVRWLSSKKTNNILKRNFQIGKKYHDYEIMKNLLIKKLGL